jgi:hypothetical protein
MGIAYNTSIVRDGLVLHLDAANVKSYPGTGTTWKDLSGNVNDFTLSGVDFVSTNPKHFSLIDNQGDYAYRSSTDVIGGLNDFTFDIIMRIDSFPDALTTFVSYATTSNNNAVLFARNGSGQLAMWLGSSNFDTATGPVDSDYNVGNFIHFVLTRSGTNIKVYINGELKSNNNSYFNGTVQTGGTLVFGQEQDTPGGSFQTVQDFPGDIACYKIYNKVLSDTEIKQNFEALRGRYGI